MKKKMTREEAEQARSRELGEARAMYDKVTAKIDAAFKKVDERHTDVMRKWCKASHKRALHPVAFPRAEKALLRAQGELYDAMAIRNVKRQPYEKAWHRAIARINRKYPGCV